MKELKFKNIEKEIAKKKTLFNFYFDYKFSLKQLNKELTNSRILKPNTQEDVKERLFLMKNIDRIVKKIKIDKGGRQCCFSLNYKDNFFTRCPSLIHFQIDYYKLNMVVYMRSWNYLKNFQYDIQTMSLLLYLVSKKLNKCPNKITFVVYSLHLNPTKNK